MTFTKNGYQVVKNAISADLLENLKIQFEIMRDVHFLNTQEPNKYAFADFQSLNSFCVYAAPFFESLAIQLNDKISEIVEVDLIPTYTYARIYYKGSSLKSHRDRASCEYSSTLCIDTTHLWDFYIEDMNGRINKLELSPGDMCIYAGNKLKHWRKPYKGEKQMQCFLHYVNKNGDNKDFLYDKRPMMGMGTKIAKMSREIY